MTGPAPTSGAGAGSIIPQTGANSVETIGLAPSLPLRARLAGRWARLSKWEYWPAWAVYAPLFPYWAWLSLRHGGARSWTLANTTPALRRIVGESKSEVLRVLPPEWTLGGALITPGSAPERARRAEEEATQRGWSFPIILKPDAGERGVGVRLIHSLQDAESYFARHAEPVLAQEYHPGVHEAGVFYVRRPGARAGEIFAITDKRFPGVTGDGVSRVRELIWKDQRLNAQARVFLKRLGARAERVPPRGERVRLGIAGNHAQGAMFLDGRGLITPALTRTFDTIADLIPGFCFGRFDVRYDDPGAFALGRGFKIIELNGVLSEPTNIYDPSWGYWRAQRTLRSAWRKAYEIGETNRRAGAIPDPSLRILGWWFRHRRREGRDAVSD